jgi:hypothetical protein
MNLLNRGDVEGYAVWRRILKAVVELSRTRPADCERVNLSRANFLDSMAAHAERGMAAARNFGIERRRLARRPLSESDA